MNSHQANASPFEHREDPLFASPWVALFVMLRKELTQPRKPR